MQQDATVIFVTDEPTVDPVRLVLVELLCKLHAVYSLHRSAHWQVVGEPSYGDHLLFQRLYEAIDPEIDKLAERMVHILDREAVNAELIAQGQYNLILDWTFQETCPFSRGLMVEEELVECVERTMNTLESSNYLTLGWEDFLGSIASQHEEHAFLLSARLD